MTSRRTALLILGMYVIALLTWKFIAPQTDWLWRAFAVLRFSGLNWLTISAFLAQCAVRTLPYVGLGALCVPLVTLPWRAAAPSARKLGWLRLVLNGLGALVLSLLLVGLVRGISHGALWSAPGLLLGLGCALGVCSGDVLVQRGVHGDVQSSARGAWRAFGAWLLRMLWLLLLGSVSVELVGYMLLSADATATTRAVVTSAQKRVIVLQLKAHNPLRMAPQQTTLLDVPLPELSAALAWATLFLDREARVDVGINNGALTWRASLRTPRLLGRQPVLNFGGTLRGELQAGELRVDACAYELGSVHVSGWLCRASLRAALRAAQDDRTFGSLLVALHAVQIDAQGLRASYGQVVLDAKMHAVIERMIGPDLEVQAAVTAQLASLRANAASYRRQQDAFGAVLRGAFALAQSRSEQGDAATENQGAILALAAVLGHVRVATLAGLPGVPDTDAIVRELGAVTVHGRSDWVKHFLVSAGLTQISTVLVSDAAGLLKEELDANGGSGFSFGDLLADRAGTMFGEAAVRDAHSAWEVQVRIVNEYRLEDFLPAGSDFPENLQDAAFKARYGGVGGVGYRAVVATIEARLKRCAMYR